MSQLRRLLLTALPKVALSRLCGLLAATPLPRSMRRFVYGTFARRYGVNLDEAAGELGSFRSLQQFFQRSLRPGARPVAAAELVWPCDGRIVTAGPVDGDRIEQVKGQTYSLADFVGDAALAQRLAGGSQATIYLAPGDYHRVHAPFAATITSVVPLPGTLFPVNPPAVRCIRDVFARNARHVFHCLLDGGVMAAVVMVGAYNVGGTRISAQSGHVNGGDEIGQFGFGSTVVVVVAPGGPRFRLAAPEQRTVMGERATDA